MRGHASVRKHWSRRRDRVSEFATVMKASKRSYLVLLVSWGTLGNLNPLLTAGRRLRRNGHHVRVMADPTMRAEVEAAEFEFVTWRRAPIGEAADPADFSDMQDWFRRAMFVPAAAYAADIQDEIGRIPTDAVLSLDLLFGAALGAEVSDVPFAFLSPHVSLRTLPGMPPATRGLGQPRTPQERAEVDAANAGLAAALNGFLPILNRARAELGLPMLADVMDLFDRADRLLLATSQAFDFQADSLPDNFRYVGPLLDVPSWSKSLQAKSWQAMVRTVGASSRTRGLQHGRARPARYVSARPRRDRNHRCRSPCNNRPQFGRSRSPGTEECACAPWRSPRLGHEGRFPGGIARRPRNGYPFTGQRSAAAHSANGTGPGGERRASRGEGCRASLAPDGFRSGNGRGDEPAAHGAAI